MKIAHISDVHIHNNKYHEEYRIVFSQLYSKLKKQKPDIIVITGDVAHSKNNISPEFVQMCSEFFDNLQQIALLLIVPGNHDGILSNHDRQDALTPIVDILIKKGANIKYLKKSCEFHYDDQFCFNNMSIFDRPGWVKPTKPEKVNIALYHGTINGVSTDAGFVLTRGEDNIDIFNEMDFALLGDIHKANQVVKSREIHREISEDEKEKYIKEGWEIVEEIE
jgi:predicted phosphodiesterase